MCNGDGWTVAMIVARLGKIPHGRFRHNPYFMNKYGETVFDLL